MKDATSVNIKLYLHLGRLSMDLFPRSGITMSKVIDTFNHLDTYWQITFQNSYLDMCGACLTKYPWQPKKTPWWPTQEPLFSLLIKVCFVSFPFFVLMFHWDQSQSIHVTILCLSEFIFKIYFPNQWCLSSRQKSPIRLSASSFCSIFLCVLHLCPL